MYEITGVKKLDDEESCEIYDVYPMSDHTLGHQCGEPAWYAMQRNGLDGPYQQYVCEWHLRALCGITRSTQ